MHLSFCALAAVAVLFSAGANAVVDNRCSACKGVVVRSRGETNVQ